jgi:hypothetical protein
LGIVPPPKHHIIRHPVVIGDKSFFKTAEDLRDYFKLLSGLLVAEAVEADQGRMTVEDERGWRSRRQ